MNRKLATICETDDYSKFKFLDANRPVTHAKKIMESIQDIGVLWQPILVNENFEIIDGQGRFMAMKTLGKPIVYVVQPGLGIKHVRYLNQNATVWKLQDYAHSYAVGEDARQSYANLEVVRKQFPEFDHMMIVRSASKYTLLNNNQNKLRNGEYDGMDLEDMNVAISRLTELRKQSLTLEGLRAKKHLQYALLFCIYLSEEHADFSLTQLFESMQQRKRTFEFCGSMTEAIKLIDSAYNFNRQAKNRFNIQRAYEDCLAEVNPRTFKRLRR